MHMVNSCGSRKYTLLCAQERVLLALHDAPPTFNIIRGSLGHDGPSKGGGHFGYDRFALTEIP